MGMMGAGFLLFILLLVAIGYVAYRLGQSQSNGPEGGGRADQTRGDKALEAVRRRYAEGEIDREEFERLRRDLA
jgi:putative membrane protein